MREADTAAKSDGEDSVTTAVESSDELTAVETTVTPESLPTVELASPKHAALLMFSGAMHDNTSLQSCLEAFGFSVDAYDILNGAAGDLSDDSVWDPLLAKIRSGKYIAAVISPPCGTFSRLRNVPGGPPPLRSANGRERYGLSTLDKGRAETVRLHNLLALRGITAFKCIAELGGVAIFEQPALIDNEVSMLRLDEFVEVLALPGVHHQVAAQCPFGAPSQKLTSWVSCNFQLRDLPPACTHSAKPWYEQGTGTMLMARHPPTRGKTKFYSTLSEAQGAVVGNVQYISASLANYPPLLNRYLAASLKLASKNRVLSNFVNPSAHAWDSRTGKEQVSFSQHLKGAPPVSDRDEKDLQAIGGLRNAAHSVQRLTQLSDFGQGLGKSILECILQNPAWIDSTCALIGGEQDLKADPSAIQAVRQIIEKQCDFVPSHDVPQEDCSTLINARLLEAWRLKAMDPDHEVCQWLLTGAPAGLAKVPQDCGIFPTLDDSPKRDFEELCTDFDTFENYAGVDADSDALKEIEAHVEAGHLRAFDTLDGLRAYLGAEPVLNKIGVITKERAGKVKKRIILDTKVAGTKECSAKHQRVLLPRLLDAILQSLILYDQCGPDESMDWFVLDFSDAFWQMPLHPSERRFFCARVPINGVMKYVVYLRTVQGHSYYVPRLP